ncbi:Uncharacterised protein (plasmid) [Tsukamurella tyrosinosolvens]|uniref:Uncharacterized protein n=3 Tax=Tsukamurella TaxID=2060 RepID=A0A5C5RNU0_9ACTN|nr:MULTISPECIES: hypothetical protein [Tsukamurella]KXO92577.1 hypothetical protein AXK58_18330 [Tsukamurella tyrosinosolvens]KXO93828.1 hypothetical protein AXK56_21970 [Tsukamurella pulmonis]TWS24143.1 hypothetical protein FK268_11000 [Tsukamurella sputi]SDQ49786.1 hypothetical protein SAMN04489765_0643 [Tsukamurella pulmonis]SED55620.1 hypothetical protein SAMN04489793_5188 [Tsukamurella tyrosinosolvens]
MHSAAATLREHQTEQDVAAGGEVRRRVVCDDGRVALGRVKLNRRRKARRTYAFLIWREHGERRELMLGEATARTFPANLRAAWDLVHAHRLTTAEGRRTWPQTRHQLHAQAVHDRNGSEGPDCATPRETHS